MQEECIRVPKVYDWVFDAFSTDRGVVLPDECAAAVAEAVADERTPLDVVCAVPDVGGFFPLDPDPDPDATCSVSPRIERREVYVGGELREVAIVGVTLTITPQITIIDSEGDEICNFPTTPIRETRRLVVCAPEPFHK